MVDGIEVIVWCNTQLRLSKESGLLKGRFFDEFVVIEEVEESSCLPKQVVAIYSSGGRC